MNDSSRNIRDDYQSLNSLERITSLLKQSQEEIYRYEPATVSIRGNYNDCRMGLEALISCVDKCKNQLKK